jgi:hypothetical protein
MIAIHTRPLWLATLAVALPVASMAQPVPVAPSEDTRSAAALAFSSPVSADMLEEHRGGSAAVRSEMTLTGNTSGNTAINVAAGNNAINAGSFSNLSGLPVVIQNSGANVLIQSALILNLTIN